jgi:TolA-binding protein
MSEEKQPESEQKPIATPAEEAIRQAEADPGSGQNDEAKEQLLQFGKQALMYVLAILVAVSLAIGYKVHRQSSKERDSERLWTAKTIQDLDGVIDSGSSSSAALALIKAAKRQYDTQRYDLAMKKYGEFQSRFPSHPLIEVAEIGKLHCIEARGQIQEAMEGFVAFAKAHPKHFLAPQALLGEARCLGQLGRVPEAKARCEEFIVKHADSPWKARAEDLLKSIGRLANRPAPIGAGAGAFAPGAFPPAGPTPVSVTVPIPSEPAPAPAAAPARSNLQIKLDLGLPPAAPAK